MQEFRRWLIRIRREVIQPTRRKRIVFLIPSNRFEDRFAKATRVAEQVNVLSVRKIAPRAFHVLELIDQTRTLLENDLGLYTFC